MAQLPQPFNAQQFDPSQSGGFSQLPAGLHPVKIIASEVKANDDNTGGSIIFELEAIDGPSRGKTQTMRVPLYHATSDKARKFAESRMAALSYVTGIFMVTDTAQFHNIPFVVSIGEQTLTPDQVTKKNAGEQVTPFTQVDKILDMAGNEPKGGAAAPAQQHQQPAQQQPVAQPSAPAAGAWGQQQPVQAPAQPAGQAWGGGQPAQQPVAQPAAGGWQQGGAPAGGKPAWGAK